VLWIFIVIPAAIWCVLRLILPNQRWEFDFDVTHATFTLLLDRYQKISGWMIATSLAGAAYGRWRGSEESGVQCCLLAALYAFFFIVYTVTRYEGYLHSKYRQDGRTGESPYTTSQYALTRTMGYSAVIFLLMGITMVFAR
jgi:hypothetical protein